MTDSVTLSLTDPAAQRHLWAYACEREPVNFELAQKIKKGLLSIGYTPPSVRQVDIALRLFNLELAANMLATHLLHVAGQRPLPDSPLATLLLVLGR